MSHSSTNTPLETISPCFSSCLYTSKMENMRLYSFIVYKVFYKTLNKEATKNPASPVKSCKYFIFQWLQDLQDFTGFTESCRICRILGDCGMPDP